MTRKETIYNLFAKQLQQKIVQLNLVLLDLKNIAANETKSTAGDKHETALAMVQIEQAKLRSQLQVLLNQQEIIKKINPLITPIKVVMGCLVNTNNGEYFISTALGKVILNNNTIQAMSPMAPLGAILLGLCVKDTFNFNKLQYTITSIN